MVETSSFRIGPHDVDVRNTAGRWTASVDGCPVKGFFGSEAQASGAALVTIALRERDHAALGTGDTLVCQTAAQIFAGGPGRPPPRP